MHLFLIRDGLGAIGHLHPLMRDSSRFEARTPPLPAGRYRVYADVVHESGFAQTMTASGRSPRRLGGRERDAVGSGRLVVRGRAGRRGRRSDRVPLDGARLIWERAAGPIVAGREQELRFRVVEPDGSPVALEPYLGMAAHAVVTRADGSVFAHLHPTGSVAMASQMALTMRTPADSVARHAGPEDRVAHDARRRTPVTGGAFRDPYGFPPPAATACGSRSSSAERCAPRCSTPTSWRRAS